MAIVRVHRRRIHQVVARMELEMEMGMHQTWAHYPHPHRVCLIQHQVSTLHSHIGQSTENRSRSSSIFRFFRSVISYHEKKSLALCYACHTIVYEFKNYRLRNLYHTHTLVEYIFWCYDFEQKENVKNIDNSYIFRIE